MSGYEISYSEAEDMQSSQTQVLPEVAADPAPDLQPIAPFLPPHPPVLPLPPFDFDDLMRRSGGNSASLFRLLPPGPIIVHSQRAGGGVRYLYVAYVAYFAYDRKHF